MVQVIDKKGRKHKMPLSLHAHLQNVILDRHAFWFLLECCRVRAVCMYARSTYACIQACMHVSTYACSMCECHHLHACMVSAVQTISHLLKRDASSAWKHQLV